MRIHPITLASVVLPLVASFAPSAIAQPAQPDDAATFALVIGVNRAADRDLPALRYADDDAARYLELFRSLGARTYVLARLDDNTRRMHPQVAAEALEPRAGELARAVAALAADVARARERGVTTVLYVVYAGHGNVEDGRGYLALEDGRLTGPAIERDVIDRVGAKQTHVIVDACYSYFLAFGRGPGGGRRRELHGFSRIGGLAARPSVGLLLSTSSARESHEWSGFEAGVFSHEVRSGLYGAADADGDGRVSYREIAAFVERANASIANARFRPDVFVRSAAGAETDATLLDLRRGLARRLEVDVAPPGHYLVEDTRGVRIADFHARPERAVALVRPASSGVLYLRHLADDREIVVPAGPDVARTSELAVVEGRVLARGAANDAYQRAFELPFDEAAVASFRWPQPADEAVSGSASAPADAAAAIGPRRGAAAGAAGIAAVAFGLSGLELVAARDAHSDGRAATTQEDAARFDDRVHRHNVVASIAALAGVVAASTAIGLWLTEGAAPIEASVGAHDALVSLRGRF